MEVSGRYKQPYYYPAAIQLHVGLDFIAKMKKDYYRIVTGKIHFLIVSIFLILKIAYLSYINKQKVYT